jgi:hypothetical protein
LTWVIFAWNVAVEVKTGDHIHTRLFALDAADVVDHLVERIAHLHDVPTRRGQLRDEDDEWLAGHNRRCSSRRL